MTMVNAINEMMSRGITSINDGRTAQEVLEWAVESNRIAALVIETGNGDVKGWQYYIDHENDNFIVETNGHFIIATWYECANGTRFPMATYGDYATYEEMESDFDAWNIAREAEEIADKMSVECPGELPHMAWVLIATAELKAARKAAEIAFEREFNLNNGRA